MVQNYDNINSEDVQPGTVLWDFRNREWIVGERLGQGACGVVNMIKEISSDNYEYAVKFDYADGLVDKECYFYTRTCSEENVTSWMNEKQLQFLGVPSFVSSGREFLFNTTFLIMDRYGDNLHKLLLTNNLSRKYLCQIAINILDVLEYVHSKGRSHCDIKASNIVQGYKSPEEIYLIDFGLHRTFTFNGEHIAEIARSYNRHVGTALFCSRDSHRGLISSRRSDLESLMFNLIFWLTWDRNNNGSEEFGFGKLPWLMFLKDWKKNVGEITRMKIAESKEIHMNDLHLFIESVGLDIYPWSKHILNILTSISKLKYDEVPKYDDIRSLIATIICEIDNQPVPSSIDIDEFCEIDWENNSPTIDGPCRLHNVTKRKRHVNYFKELDHKKTVKRQKMNAPIRRSRRLAAKNSCSNL